jgi:AraC family transcriptional regulator
MPVRDAPIDESRAARQCGTFAPTITAARLPGAHGVSVFAYRCRAGPHDRPYVEQHGGHSLAYIHAGSFACCCRGCRFELTTGALMVGHPGDEYMCVHDHHPAGDAGVSFGYSDELVERLGAGAAWRRGALPPLAQIAPLGELARAAAQGRSDVAPAEVGLLLAERFVVLVASERSAPRAPSAADRQRVLRAAQWLEAQCGEAADLDGAAAQAGLSAFHFLRVFRRVLGVTPHQYLIRCRLRRAARLLVDEALPVTTVAFEAGFGDLSNFVRTFGRAAGMSPQRFRRLAHRGPRIHTARFAKTAPT